MKRNIWFWLYFIIAIVLAIYFATRVIWICTGRSALSYIRTISITTDSANKNLDAIAAAVAVAPGTRAYSANLANINSRVASVPGVRQSAVHRRPDGNLSVKVDFYRAIAQWTDGTYYYPLSSDGTIINKPSETRTNELVTFRGALPNDISGITESAQNMANNINYMEWIENRRWNMVTNDGITIMLPEHDAASAIASLGVINKNHGILSKKLNFIDMRDDARILIK